MLKAFLTGVLLLTAALPARAANSDAAAMVIAMEQRALNIPDGFGFLDISAPEVIYLDPELKAPLIGLKALTDYYKAAAGASEPSTGTMSHTNVQQYGDIAILTYCYESKKVKSGKITLWNIVEVYRKTGETWKIVNSHYAYKEPKLAPE